MLMFVPIELFDALAENIARLPTVRPCGAATVELDGTHYAAVYDGRDGLRVASREGSPVTLADIRDAGFTRLETLPPHVVAKMEQAFAAQQRRFLVALASRYLPFDVDAAPA